MESWPEVVVANFAPSSDAQIISIHVLARDVAFEPGLLGIDFVLDLPNDVAKGDSSPP